MRIVAAGLLGILATQSYAETAVATPAAASDDSGLEEVVVTAQRRTERLQDVPISVLVFSQATMDAQGTRDIDDVARLTPGLSFTRGAVNNNSESSDIAIRGIDSTAGAATNGIYIDDTPIQSRHLSFGTFNAYPQLFDIDRVEVLRGPQGTLFGSGSEGGTLRFITPNPASSNALRTRAPKRRRRLSKSLDSWTWVPYSWTRALTVDWRLFSMRGKSGMKQREIRGGLRRRSAVSAAISSTNSEHFPAGPKLRNRALAVSACVSAGQLGSSVQELMNTDTGFDGSFLAKHGGKTSEGERFGYAKGTFYRHFPSYGRAFCGAGRRHV